MRKNEAVKAMEAYLATCGFLDFAGYEVSHPGRRHNAAVWWAEQGVRAGIIEPDEEPAEVRTPQEWCDRFNVRILDPDGWRGRYAQDWDQPITESDFQFRANLSTTYLRGTNGNDAA